MCNRRILSVCLTITISACSHAPTSVKQADAVEGTYTLSRVVQDRLTGMIEVETAESRAEILKEVRSCLEGRTCEATVEKLEGDDELERPTPAARSSKKSRGPKGRKQRQAFEKAVVEGDLDALERLSPGFDLGGILRSVKSLDRIKLLSNRSLEKSGCDHAALLVGLGGTAEQFFPEDEAYELSTKLYERAVACGAGAGAARAGYRLGLLYLMKERWSEADAQFEKLESIPESYDFLSRITYWRWFTAQKLGRRSVASEMKRRLEENYPLSLHTLLISDDGVRSAGEKLSDRDPAIQFRSELAPEVNARVRIAEALLWEGADSRVGGVLDPVMATLRERKVVEPGFQLYLAVLLMRAGENIRKFQWVSNLFRDQPALISQTTLQLVYPVKRMQLIKDLANGRHDPFLVLALIRQESAFNERAKSRAGARGLMQLMPMTARRMENGSQRKLFDPEVNVRLGIRYLDGLLGRFSGDAELSLAAYNAGPERVDNWLKRYPVQNRLLFLDLIPFKETREYVASIARNYYWYLRLYDLRKFSEGVIPSEQATTRGAFPVFGLDQDGGSLAVRQDRDSRDSH